MANELRIRTNFLSGTITDAPLTNVATALNSAALASLPAIDATQHAVLVLDPDGSAGAPEIVYVTAHTAAATSATVLRAQEGSVARSHASGTVWRNTATVLDYDDGLLPTNRQTASYTLVLADRGKVVEMNVASANTLTVPPNSSVAFPVGTILEVLQYGAGQTTLTPGAAVTLRSSGAKLKLSAQYASASLRKIGTDEWVVAGDLVA